MTQHRTEQYHRPMRISDLVDAIGDRVRVVCGDDRTQEIIRWVHVTDLLEPGRYLRGGELILTNALWYRRPEDAWTFVGDLVAHGVHAVGIALYPGQVLRDGLEQACRHHQVVLLTFDDIAFIDITELVVQRQLEERKDLELRAIELARQLTSAIASGGTGGAFLDILRGELGWDCWFVTGDGVVSSSGRAVTLAEGLRAWSASLDPAARRRPLRPITFGDGRTATAIAVPGDWIGAAALALATVVVEAAPERMPATEPVVTDLLRTYLPLAVDRTLTLRALRRGSLATLLVRLESPGRPDAADIEDLLVAMDLSPVTGSGYLVVKVSAGAQHAALPPAVEASCRLRGTAAVATEYGADGAAICLIRAVEADPAQLAAEIWNDLRGHRIHCGGGYFAPGHRDRGVDRSRARGRAGASGRHSRLARHRLSHR